MKGEKAMSNLVTIKGKDWPVIEWKGQRVITTAQLAEFYEATEQQVQQNFNNNQENFSEGLHYFYLKSEELKEFKRYFDNIDLPMADKLKFVPHLYLWTRQGASRHCKILGTPRAWEQFDILEDNYYNPRPQISVVDEILNNPDFGIKLLEEYKVKKEENKQLQLEVKVKEQQINELQPKATYYDLVLQCKDLISISKIAKDYGKSAQWMNNKLRELGIQYNQGGVWLLYQKYADKGYTSTKTHAYTGNDGLPHTKPLTYWTQKGRLFIYELLKSEGILPSIEREE